VTSSSARRWKRNPHVVARRIGNDTILVPTGSDIVDQKSLFTLNDTGSFIWQELARPRTAAQIRSALVEAFDVDADQARTDLDGFLEALARAGCITQE
jgi:hypothetical protein